MGVPWVCLCFFWLRSPNNNDNNARYVNNNGNVNNNNVNNSNGVHPDLPLQNESVLSET